MRGKFISIEGPDGVGKSTQARRLASALQANGLKALLLGEPNNAAIGGIIRRALRKEIDLDTLTMALLFAANRQDFSTHLTEYLDAGVWVVGDRGMLSTWAYVGASFGGDMVRAAWADELSAFCVWPDLVVVLTAPIDVCAARRSQRDAEMYEDAETQEHVHRMYDVAAGESCLGTRVRYVCADRTEDAVHADILRTVRAYR